MASLPLKPTAARPGATVGLVHYSWDRRATFGGRSVRRPASQGAGDAGRTGASTQPGGAFRRLASQASKSETVTPHLRSPSLVWTGPRPAAVSRSSVRSEMLACSQTCFLERTCSTWRLPLRYVYWKTGFSDVISFPSENSFQRRRVGRSVGGSCRSGRVFPSRLLRINARPSGRRDRSIWPPRRSAALLGTKPRTSIPSPRFWVREPWLK
jgi:hypothetical protein